MKKTKAINVKLSNQKEVAMNWGFLGETKAEESNILFVRCNYKGEVNDWHKIYSPNELIGRKIIIH